MLESHFTILVHHSGFSVPITASQKRFLRGRAHHINPVVMVGDKGLTENVLAELERALDHHELIKVRLRLDRQTRSALVDEIAQQCGAELVQKIGQVACFFRRNPERPVIRLPQ
jgi:RNA-binding protein